VSRLLLTLLYRGSARLQECVVFGGDLMKDRNPEDCQNPFYFAGAAEGALTIVGPYVEVGTTAGRTRLWWNRHADIVVLISDNEMDETKH
jgi:hypothetical protein